MKTDNKKGWLLWAVIFLLVMNLSTMATIIYYRMRSGKTTNLSAAYRMPSETATDRFSGRYFRDKLSLDPSQTDQFVKINHAFRQHARTISFEMASKRKQMFSEMNTEEPDTVRLNALSDSIGYLHADLKRLTFRYYVDLRNMCHTNQRQELEQIFENMFNSDAPVMQGPGMRGMRGRMHGRGMNYYNY